MNENLETPRPPLPFFNDVTAQQKVRLAEDGWNSRDALRVSLAYTPDSVWRSRAEFLQGRAEIEQFLIGKWNRELDYRLIKELWAFHENLIAVRFAYEWHDETGDWYRSYGNENWEFDPNGYMKRRIASINDLRIKESDRLFFWPLGARPSDHLSLTDLGLEDDVWSFESASPVMWRFLRLSNESMPSAKKVILFRVIAWN